MGAGSSKKSPPSKTAHSKSVANVNKQHFMKDERGEIEVKQTPLKDNDNNEMWREEHECQNNKRDKEKEKDARKRMKFDQKPKENTLIHEDLENDIDEVLKIPMAIEYPKPKKKDKNKKTSEIMNADKVFDQNVFNSQANSNGHRFSEKTEILPETYAQRLQRQQYKLQQDLLIRQKTMYRNENDWDDVDDDEIENLKTKGFDASKFRAANKGGDVKKDLFKTSSGQEELETPRYLQTDQDIDGFQTNTKQGLLHQTLPSYNQSEIDLMQEMERDLL